MAKARTRVALRLALTSDSPMTWSMVRTSETGSPGSRDAICFCTGTENCNGSDAVCTASIPLRHLQEWGSTWPPWLFTDLVQGVADHAHDFVIDVVGRSSMEMRRNVQVLADGIVTGEVLPDKLTAHNHLVRSSNAFVAGKEPATHKRNPESAEKAWIGPAHQRIGRVFARLERRMLLHGEYVVSPISCSGKSVSQCGSANPGNGSHPLQQCFIECVHLLRRVVFLFRQAVLQREHVFGNAAHIGRAQPQKALEQQPRGNQQDHRDSNLRREE